MAYNEKSDPAINEAKSLGQQYKNVVIRGLRAGLAARDIVNKTLDVVEEELEGGICKSALKLIEIAKEPDKQDISITGKGVTIQVASESDKDMIEGI